ncbi:hypothetical protein BDA96_01G484200 [Sorghum bicolor]|jgi:hypothetical protein|uniref:Uncharacterized protein n=2 Tax=Sorghum bicolor TaxID=4558 RepID=A0A921V1F7_SORBI|nr:hypothetical protein BDA96_01G402100 [Sorghum bicolor]KAG0552147.1 hypothetical protein BDA96_01G484200 [Sorghum bicolor]OQU92633.1 hypothetical protein SORBI_3001G378001 [Sorghum bicolor]
MPESSVFVWYIISVTVSVSGTGHGELAAIAGTACGECARPSWSRGHGMRRVHAAIMMEGGVVNLHGRRCVRARRAPWRAAGRRGHTAWRAGGRRGHGMRRACAAAVKVCTASGAAGAATSEQRNGLRSRHWHSGDKQRTAAYVDQAYSLNAGSGLGPAGD